MKNQTRQEEKEKSTKTIFWNVDTQYDFMRNDASYKGNLPIPDAREIEGNLEKLTKLAERERIKVVNTGDSHTSESKEFSDKPDYVNTFPTHCIQGTKGAEYVPATNPKDSYEIDWQKKTFDAEKAANSRNITIYKDEFSVFTGSPHTEKVLDIVKPDKVIVYGVATNFCVDYAVTGLREKGIDVYVVTDAIKEIPLDGEPQKTFDKWKKLKVNLTTTEKVLKMYQ